MGTPLTQTELEILKQVDEHDGMLNLDLSDELHYRYYVDSFGGEELLKANTPTLYEMIRYRRDYDRDPEKFSDQQLLDVDVPLLLEDYAKIENARIDAYESGQRSLKKDGDANLHYEIKNTFEASYASCPVASLGTEVKIIDMDYSECIQRYMDTLTPDENHTFTSEISAPIEDNQIERERAYRTMVTVTQFSPTKNNGCLLRSSVISSVIYSRSTNEDIREINLIDPQIRHADSRNEHKDVICISYKRDSNLKSPDYSYNTGIVKEGMPVYLDFALTVALRNDAYFRLDEGSYLCKRVKPDIHLTRFDNEQGKPVSEGRARLYQDWTSFMEDHVEVVETDEKKRATKLKLTFPNEWKSNLSLEKVKNAFTYAELYAMISFNTSNTSSQSTAKKKEYIDQTTTIFVRKQPNPDDQCNPSKPGKNGVHVPRLYYQWGCLGKDTILLGENGPVRACDVKIHDRLMTRDGKWAKVENIYSGEEETILHITHEKGEILLTPDHTLFNEDMTPVTAENVTVGSRLVYLDSETMQEEVVTVTKTETVPYTDKVYNFKFAQPEYLIANGLLTGDYDWQQKVRPSLKAATPVPMNQRIQDAMKELEALRNAPADLHDVTAVFSDKAECMTLHYFALKTLACFHDLYAEDEAQTIAEYCQYIGDNANIGALRVKSVPDAVNCDGLATMVMVGDTPYYLVPIIPTAMVKWYDDDELANARTWSSSTDSQYFGGETVEYSYHIPQDILAPFHYPFCTSENTDGTEFFSPKLRKLMNRVAQHAAKQEKLDRSTLMAMGIVLHMLLDSLIHEGFYPSPDWRNLGRIEQIINPQGNDITKEHKPFNRGGEPFPVEDYSEDIVYPAGIKENGDASQCSYARYCYRFPTDTGELSLEAISYGGYQNYENFSRYVRGCKQMMKFLVDCKAASGAVFEETEWNKILAPALGRTFNQTADTQDAVQKLWKKEFTMTSYGYDRNTVCSRMLEGDKTKTEDEERYAEFFEFTLLINRIKKGVDLFE